MVELVAKSPCAGMASIEFGAARLSEVEMTCLTSLSPRRGQESAFAQVLKAAHGMAFPAPNRATGKEGARVVWFGKGQVMLIGPEPDAGLLAHAAMTDQSDAWAMVRLEGEAAEDVLARLVPIDLRQSVFRRGHAARTMLGHMNVSITRVSDAAFLILGFRSMVGTLVHEIETAMKGVAVRQGA